MTEFEAYRQQELLSRKTEKLLAVEYKKSQENIRNEMARLYEKYAVGGKLTFSEMSKYNRMNQLDAFIADEMKRLSGRVNSEIKRLTKEQYKQSYYSYSSNINDAIGIQLNWGVLNTDAIAAIVTEPAAGGYYLKDVLSKLRYNELLQERQTITQGLIEGDSFQNMAKRIKDQTNKSYNDSIRIARTEGTRAAGEGQAMAYDRAEELGVELKRIWDAANDSRTRSAHVALDGKKADSEGYFHYGGKKTRYPGNWPDVGMNVNCRCRIRSEVILDEE